MTFADRLAVMRSGRLEQLGLPEEVYLRPRTAFVANFLGTTNLLRGMGRGSVAETLLGTLPISQRRDGSVLLSLRPEDLHFTDHGVTVTVTGREFKGHDLTYTCQTLPDEPDTAPHRFTVQTGPGCRVRVGDITRLSSYGPAVPLEGSAAAES